MLISYGCLRYNNVFQIRQCFYVRYKLFVVKEKFFGIYGDIIPRQEIKHFRDFQVIKMFNRAKYQILRTLISDMRVNRGFLPTVLGWSRKSCLGVVRNSSRITHKNCKSYQIPLFENQKSSNNYAKMPNELHSFCRIWYADW